MKWLLLLIINFNVAVLAAQKNIEFDNQPKDSTLFSLPFKEKRNYIKPVSFNEIYHNQLGFMCQQEVKLEKATKTSLRFRLGSVEYTDKMEGKFAPVRRFPVGK